MIPDTPYHIYHPHSPLPQTDYSQNSFFGRSVVDLTQEQPPDSPFPPLFAIHTPPSNPFKETSQDDVMMPLPTSSPDLSSWKARASFPPLSSFPVFPPPTPALPPAPDVSVIPAAVMCPTPNAASSSESIASALPAHSAIDKSTESHLVLQISNPSADLSVDPVSSNPLSISELDSLADQVRKKVFYGKYFHHFYPKGTLVLHEDQQVKIWGSPEEGRISIKTKANKIKSVSLDDLKPLLPLDQNFLVFREHHCHVLAKTISKRSRICLQGIGFNEKRIDVSECASLFHIIPIQEGQLASLKALGLKSFPIQIDRIPGLGYFFT